MTVARIVLVKLKPEQANAEGRASLATAARAALTGDHDLLALHVELPADAVPGTPARDFLGIEDDYLIVLSKQLQEHTAKTRNDRESLDKYVKGNAAKAELETVKNKYGAEKVRIEKIKLAAEKKRRLSQNKANTFAAQAAADVAAAAALELAATSGAEPAEADYDDADDEYEEDDDDDENLNP